MKLNIFFLAGDFVLVATGVILAGFWGGVLVGVASTYGMVKETLDIPSAFSRDFWRGRNELNS